MIENEKVLMNYNKIKEMTNESYANITLMNSLKLVGVKKAYSDGTLNEKDYKLVNNFKYPERLIKMMSTVTERFDAQGSFGFSFTKIAFSHDINFNEE